MSISKKKIIIPSVIVLIIIAIIVTNVLQKQEKGLKVQSAKVGKGNLIATVSASGSIQPEASVKISSNIMGKIVKLNIEEGDYVKEGDILLKLDPERYSAALEQTEANLRASLADKQLYEANLEESKFKLERQKAMFEKGLVSQEQLTSLETAVKVQEANLKRAVERIKAQEASLKSARDALDKTIITSPMSGIISQLNIEVGEVVVTGTMNNAGTVLMIISDLSIMEVEVEVDESEIVYIKKNQEVKIEVDALPDSVFKGKVTEIANSATVSGYGTQEQVTNFKVVVTLIDSCSLLRPGMSATVDIITATKDSTIYVPMQCVVMRTDREIKAAEDARAGKIMNKRKGKKGGKKGNRGSNGGNPNNNAGGNPKKDIKEIQGVYVIEEIKGIKGKYSVFVAVKTGIADDANIEIISGLEENQEVVSGGYRALQNLKSGEQLRISNFDEFDFNKR